mmetsp:Transcript_1872/g.3733  ORF Transcript_1872/g.3733 Transcript_1872/m.3733 type:complete len:224 (-) Transcript_1872:362-1033(-)
MPSPLTDSVNSLCTSSLILSFSQRQAISAPSSPSFIFLLFFSVLSSPTRVVSSSRALPPIPTQVSVSTMETMVFLPDLSVWREPTILRSNSEMSASMQSSLMRFWESSTRPIMVSMRVLTERAMSEAASSNSLTQFSRRSSASAAWLENLSGTSVPRAAWEVRIVSRAAAMRLRAEAASPRSCSATSVREERTSVRVEEVSSKVESGMGLARARDVSAISILV